MKTKKILTAVLIAAMAFTACSGDEDVAINDHVTYNITINEAGKLEGTVMTTQPNTVITLSYRTHGGTKQATSTDLALGKSDASGNVNVAGELKDKTQRVIEFSADNYTTSTTLTFGKVPKGFLTNRTANRMSQVEARAFAAYHGGRLPLVGGKTVYKWSEYTAAISSTTVDGFGIYNVSQWPADVPTDASIWTDTEDTEYDDGSYWLISSKKEGEDKYIVATGATWDTATDTWWVICLP